MAITTRLATPADASLLATVARRTFFDAFASSETGPDLQIHMDRHFGEPQQRAELNDPGVRVIVMEDDGAAIGYALLGDDPVPACVKGDGPLQIRRFYIDQVWRGRGVAQQLMAAVESVARSWDKRTLWLLAWDQNPRAHAFYRKCGFADVGRAPYLFGNTWESDYAMTKTVDP